MNRKSYWGIAALIVFVIAAGGFIYYQLSEVQQFKKQLAQEAAEVEELGHQSEKSKKVSKTGNKAEQATGVTPADSNMPPAEKPRNETTSVTDKTKPTQAQTAAPADSAEAADVPVSPYGFGPYPEVPEDMPGRHLYTWPTSSAEHELLNRVLIQLWTSGERNFRGGSTQNGKIYPHYHDTVYVTFREYERRGKTIRFASDITSGPHVRYTAEELLNPPPHLRVLDLETSGIDPYQYLNLPR